MPDPMSPREAATARFKEGLTALEARTQAAESAVWDRYHRDLAKLRLAFHAAVDAEYPITPKDETRS